MPLSQSFQRSVLTLADSLLGIAFLDESGMVALAIAALSSSARSSSDNSCPSSRLSTSNRILRRLAAVSADSATPPSTPVEEQTDQKVVAGFDYKRVWPHRSGGEHSSQEQAEWSQHFDGKSPSRAARSVYPRLNIITCL